MNPRVPAWKQFITHKKLPYAHRMVTVIQKVIFLVNSAVNPGIVTESCEYISVITHTL